MNNTQIFTTLLAALTSVFCVAVSYADGDEERIFTDWSESKKPGVSPVAFKPYNAACGSCHFAYQPGLLPSVSWQRIMLHLDDHFGVSPKLSPAETSTITRYLLDHSAGHVNDELSYLILSSFDYGSDITRITTTPYFVRVHDQLSLSVNKTNLAQCVDCHERAADGKY